MQMSDHEILYHYNHAVDPAAQVKILAQLNAVDVPTMRNKLLDLGAVDVPAEKTSTPKRKGTVTFDERRALNLYNEGLCDQDIAKELGVCRKTVADWRNKNGLKIHRKVPIAEQEAPACMSVDGLLRVTQMMQDAFPQAVVMAGGLYVRGANIRICYNADGEAVGAEMELMLEG